MVRPRPIAPTVVHRIAPHFTRPVASAPQRRRVWRTVTIVLVGWAAILAGGWYVWQKGWFDRLIGRISPRPGMESAFIAATPTPQMVESPTRAPRIAPRSRPGPIKQPTQAATLPTAVTGAK